MSTIVVIKCLSPELTVESVDDILYRIGFSFDSIRDRKNRKLIEHQMFVFIMLCYIITQRKTRSLLILFISNRN